jgi:uncharacterized protein (TIGR01777 family)
VAVFERTSEMPVSADELFAWHERPGAFQRLAPPWERMRVLEQSGGIRDGGRLVMELRKGPLRLRWVAVHRGYEPGRRFCDEQVSGPFARWVHTHAVAPAGEGATLTDRVEWALPFGPLGALVGGRMTERMLERMFAFRHRRTRDDLARHAAFADRPRLHVAITGASGLVGSALGSFLTTGGHRVTRFVRRGPLPAGGALWSPRQGLLDTDALLGADAVVHLAGEPVVGGRWTEARKRAIRDSRVSGTATLCKALAGLRTKPRVLVSASAIGYYGDRGGAELTEESRAGQGFLADVCRDWEAAVEPARRAGIRVVTLRIGVVLSPGGGALRAMLPIFRAGLGGRVGDGTQWVSWVGLDDLVGAIHHLLFADVEGPVNATAPEPETNAGLARALGRVLHRPAIVPVPAGVVRLAFGELGRETLLSGSRVLPARLLESGFHFLEPRLEGALRAEMGLAPGY